MLFPPSVHLINYLTSLFYFVFLLGIYCAYIATIHHCLMAWQCKRGNHDLALENAQLEANHRVGDWHA